MDPKTETYALSEAQHERIFRNIIVNDYFAPEAKASIRPTDIILGGQPGAGKTSLLKPAERDLNALGNTITINGDDLRVFHPQYRSLQEKDAENAARYTDLDSGRWVEKLIAEDAASIL
ncbi:zeta toxin family protein [Brucella intermedia]|uniref:zeta toxin family protein n=1 Tax=Brucella TaxID=234 RepID=UPI00094654AC|nr:zeta toxin family protein [Brucella intermedia]